MKAEWYISRDGQAKEGPFDTTTLKAMAREGQISRETLLWREGIPQWIAARKVQGLFPEKSPTAAVPPPLPTVSSVPPPLPSTSDPSLPPLRPTASATAAVPPAETHPVSAAGEAMAASRGPAVVTRATTLTPVHWAIAGATTLLALGVLALVILGMGFLNRVDEQALEAEKERLRETFESSAAAAEAAEFADWLNEPYQSQVAADLRSSVPSLDTLLYRRLRDYRLHSVPTTWEAESRKIRDGGYSGKLAYGSPYLVKGGTALGFLTDDGGVNFSYWQLDLKDGSVRKLGEHRYGLSGKFNHQQFHSQGGDEQLEFIAHGVATQKSIPNYVGRAHYVRLNLVSGRVTAFDETAEASGNSSRRDWVATEILKKRLPDSNASSISGGAAVAAANTELAKRGMHFDLNTATLSLGTADIADWRSRLASISLSDAADASRLRSLQSTVDQAPNCPLTRDLRTNLQLASAAADENYEQLRGFLQTNSGHYLRNHAALEMLHLVAAKQDEFDQYVEFQSLDPGTPARDLAILRIHEIAFAAAMREATSEAFDRFLLAFPGAAQWDQAYAHAYALDLERARYFTERSTDVEASREEIARGMYVQWRDNLRDGKNLVKAKRYWEYLLNEDDFNATTAAVQAQDAKDRDIYQEKVLALMREQNETLKRIEGIQQQQLDVAREQLQVSYNQSAILNRIDGNLADISRSLR